MPTFFTRIVIILLCPYLCKESVPAISALFQTQDTPQQSPFTSQALGVVVEMMKHPLATRSAQRIRREIRRPATIPAADSGWQRFIAFPKTKGPSISGVTRHLVRVFNGFQIGVGVPLPAGGWFIIGGRDSKGRWQALTGKRRVRLDLKEGVAYFADLPDPVRLTRSSDGWLFVDGKIRLSISSKNPWKFTGAKRILLTAEQDDKSTNDYEGPIHLGLTLGGNIVWDGNKREHSAHVGSISVTNNENKIEVSLVSLYFNNLNNQDVAHLDLTSLGFAGEIVGRIAAKTPRETPLVMEEISNERTLIELDRAARAYGRSLDPTFPDKEGVISEISVAELLLQVKQIVQPFTAMHTSYKQAIEEAIKASLFGRLLTRFEYDIGFNWGKLEGPLISMVGQRAPRGKRRGALVDRVARSA